MQMDPAVLGAAEVVRREPVLQRKSRSSSAPVALKTRIPDSCAMARTARGRAVLPWPA